ncbi:MULTISPECIES: YxeA family protein [unclassified Bacillus cereus group]|uniref:YxeA family protein n=1 Tax=unclassified Bacillus cereus group TaxID=2750818 RepID=UPI001F5808EB|nr:MULTISPECIES: YxeA family protein [unclassified Bacillus cereus group]
MKKIIILGFIIMISIGFWMGLFSRERLIPDSPSGKVMYYTKIKSPGIQNETRRYNYELFAYNQQGKKKKLVFSARKQLRKESYIRLYHTLFRGVTYWEEVQLEELPKVVKQRYKK